MASTGSVSASQNLLQSDMYIHFIFIIWRHDKNNYRPELLFPIFVLDVKTKGYVSL